MITAAELANATSRLPDPNTFRYDSIQVILHSVLEPTSTDKAKATFMQQSTATFVRRRIFGIDTWTLDNVDIKQG